MSRRKAREVILCMIFERDYHKDKSHADMYAHFLNNGNIDEIYHSLIYKDQNDLNDQSDDAKEKTSLDYNYIEKTFCGVFDNIDQLDSIISESSISWSNNRISKISLALLRLATYEMIYADDVPASAAINEAVELSKKYDSEDAYTFINGVLGAIEKSL